MDPRYIIPRVAGAVLLVAHWILSVWLDRIELLMPLFFAGLALIPSAELWKKLRLEKTPVAVRAEKTLKGSFIVLYFSVGVNILIAIAGFVLQTGFSFPYAISLLVGIGLALSGIFLAVAGGLSAKGQKEFSAHV
jgi:hypothetical protein